MPSRVETPETVPGSLRRQLASVIDARTEGTGPVEQEVRRRASAGLPTTRLQIIAYGEACYSAEVRTFLDDLGYQRLYRDDLSRAAQVLASLESPSEPQTAKGARIATRPNAIGRVFLYAVATLAVLMAAYLFLTRSSLVPASPIPTFPQRVDVPRPVLPVRSAEDARCRHSLREAGVAWCVRALTGSGSDASPGGEFRRFDRLACGDPVAVNAEMLRRALDGIMDEGALYTYDASDAAHRCAAVGAVVVAP